MCVTTPCVSRCLFLCVLVCVPLYLCVCCPCLSVSEYVCYYSLCVSVSVSMCPCVYVLCLLVCVCLCVCVCVTTPCVSRCLCLCILVRVCCVCLCGVVSGSMSTCISARACLSRVTADTRTRGGSRRGGGAGAYASRSLLLPYRSLFSRRWSTCTNAAPCQGDRTKMGRWSVTLVPF